MIDEVYGRNILCFETLSFNLLDKGLTQLTGRHLDNTWEDNNGTGKTSILDIILWVFYGIVRKGNVDSIINSDAKKNCMGGVRARGKNGQVLRIERYRKDATVGNNVLMWIEDEPVCDDDIQDRIVKELGVDADTFTRGFIFDRSASMAAMKDTDAKGFFEKLLGHDFSSWEKAAKAYQKEVESSILEVQNELRVIEARLAILVSQQEITQRLHDDRDSTVAQNLAALSVSLSEKQAQFAFIERELEKAETSAESHRGLYTAHQGLIASIGHSQSSLRLYEKRVAELTVRYQNAQAHIVATACPTCGQALPADQIARVNQQKQEEAQRAVSELNEATTARDREQDTLSGLIHQETESRPQKDYNELHRTVTELRRQRDAIVRDTSNIQAQIIDLNKPNPHAEALSQIIGAIGTNNDSLASYSASLAQWTEYSENVQVVVEMFGKTGLKSYLLDLVVPFLNSRVAYYLSILTDGNIEAHFETTTTTNREKFHLVVSKKSGGSGFDSLSQGEGDRLNLCLILALHDKLAHIIPSRILVFDELFDRIDRTGIEKISGVLRSLAQETPVLVISHNPHLAQYTDRVAEAVMDGNTSTVSYIEAFTQAPPAELPRRKIVYHG